MEFRKDGGRDMADERLAGVAEGPAQGGGDTEGGPLMSEKDGPATQEAPAATPNPVAGEYKEPAIPPPEVSGGW